MENFIRSNIDLSPLNSFGIPVRSRFFCRAVESAELELALSYARENGLKVLVLGGGSNILFTTDFPGICIRIENKGIGLISKENDTVRVRVAAGENWHSFVMHCLEQGWYGLENLSLIPGSVGAAPMQNIGAYGVEVGSRIESIRYFLSQTGEWTDISGADCAFGYRDSIFKNELKDKAIIWEVTFRLSLKPVNVIGYGDVAAVLKSNGISDPAPKDISKAIIEIRQSKLPDPSVLGNAGSFFKNPVVHNEAYERLKETWPDVPSWPAGEGLVKIPAGWLIEKTGWKGYREGNCGVHAKQALVLVNHGNASGSEILELARRIITDVEIKTGIRLKAEVNIL